MLVRNSAMHRRQVEKLMPDWGSRVGKKAVLSWASFKISYFTGWILGMATMAIFILLTWLRVDNSVAYAVMLIGAIISLGLMTFGSTRMYRLTREAMSFQGLPKRPGITKHALHSPVEFDMWLIKTRAYHRSRQESEQTES